MRMKFAEPRAMPRKQRFKPSRKPAPPAVPTTTNDDRKEIHPDDVDIETDIPARGAPDRDDTSVEKPRT